MGIEIQSSIKVQLDNSGYAYLRHFHPETSTLDIASKLGQIIKLEGIPAVQRIIPRHQEDAPSSLYSGNYGMKDFPLHTDLAHWYLPPRYLILRCVIPAPQVSTPVVDFAGMLASIPESAILRAQFLPRRKLHGKKYLLRLLQKIGGVNLLRWDSLFIVPANDEAKRIREHFTKLGARAASNAVNFTNPGDTLILDNWRILHGRSSVPDGSVERVIERVYLEEIH